MNFEVVCREDIYNQQGSLAAKSGDTVLLKSYGKGNIRQVAIVNVYGKEHSLGKLSDTDCAQKFSKRVNNILEVVG